MISALIVHDLKTCFDVVSGSNIFAVIEDKASFTATFVA